MTECNIEFGKPKDVAFVPIVVTGPTPQKIVKALSFALIKVHQDNPAEFAAFLALGLEGESPMSYVRVLVSGHSLARFASCEQLSAFTSF